MVKVQCLGHMNIVPCSQKYFCFKTFAWLGVICRRSHNFFGAIFFWCSRRMNFYGRNLQKGATKSHSGLQSGNQSVNVHCRTPYSSTRNDVADCETILTIVIRFRKCKKLKTRNEVDDDVCRLNSCTM